MKIVYNGVEFEWIEGKDFFEQSPFVQTLIENVVSGAILIDEVFEQTGDSRRITKETFSYDSIHIVRNYEYRYKADSDQNGIVQRINYECYEVE